MTSLRFAHATVLLTAAGFLFAVVGVAGCASRGKADIPPEAQACANSVPPVRARDYNERLAALKLRANSIAECMTNHGLELDQGKLQEELLHEEWVRNSNVLGGDPMHDLMLLEQELRASPSMWRRSTPARSG